MADNTYDDLERLKKNSRNGVSSLSDTYEYNVRSWLTGISGAQHTEDLTYDYNGNISSMQWRLDGTTRKYAYSYDPYRRRRSRVENETRAPRVGLSHELQHSFDLDRKLATYEKTENGIKIMEVRAVNTENRIRKRTGDPKRVEYGKKRIPEKWLE